MRMSFLVNVGIIIFFFMQNTQSISKIIIGKNDDLIPTYENIHYADLK